MFSEPVVAGVCKFEKADETIPVCLIALKEDLDPHDNIERFDFGCCMCAWAGPGDGWIREPRFTADIEAKTFTLCRADDYWQFSYSMVRYNK
jgi:hypothetical protein